MSKANCEIEERESCDAIDVKDKEIERNHGTPMSSCVIYFLRKYKEI